MSLIRIYMVFLLCNAVAFAGPFGLSKGMALSDFGGKAKKVDSINYVLTEVPSPNAHFKEYRIAISDTLGLGKIVAVGKTIDTNPHGDQMREEYEAVLDLLKRKYGRPEILEHLRSGSIWRDAGDWMMALRTKERVLVAFWLKSEGCDLPDSLEAVALEVVGLSRDKGFVTLSYEFDNWGAIVEEVKNVEKDSL